MTRFNHFKHIMKQQHRITLKSLVPYAAVLLVVPLLMAADARQAASNVDQGLEHFQQSQFQEAADAFQRAGKSLPDDARIDFDLGCAAAAEAAAGKTESLDRAVELFQRAAASTNTKLAAAGRYCLGCLAAVKAKSAFGEKPQDASPEARAEGLEALDRAVAHYRDALKIDPEYEDARYNQELIQHWVAQMKDLWRQRDRQKQREGLNLLDYVLLLETEQQALRAQAKELGRQPDTPMWREQLDESRQTQEEMVHEIEPLKQKIATALTESQSGPAAQGPGGAMPAAPGGPSAAQTAVPTADVQKAVALLSGLADRAGTEMTTAADQLRAARMADARAAQSSAVEMLDQIYMAAVPYPNLVKRAVDTQRQLVGQTTASLEPNKPATENGVDKSQPETENNAKGQASQASDEGKKTGEDKPEFDARDESWQQRRVTRWSEVMVAKAKQGLKQLPPPEPETPATAESKTDVTKTDTLQEDTEEVSATDKSAATDEATEAKVDELDQTEIAKEKEAAAAKKRIEGLRKSMQLAVQLGPQVETLTDEAASLLSRQQTSQTLPKQQQALRLLEEIAKPLADENQQDQQQQDQQQNQQQQQNQDNKDQNNQDKQDQKNQNQQNKQDQQNKDKQKQDKKDNKDKSNKDKKKDDKQNERKQPKKQPSDKDKNKAKQDKQQKQQPQTAKQMNSKKGKTKDQKEADAALRRARQRQMERRELEKAVEAQLYGPATVEKDW